MSGPPGGHPPEDRRNWHPAETIDDYLANCREGLETYSERRAAKLMGWSRAKVHRAKAIESIPADLFERLLEQDDVPSLTEMALIGQALQGRGKSQEVETCPRCEFVLRVRTRISTGSADIVLAWLREAGR
jgi:hypothetical protein